jgi:uncharacterized protein (TIGR03435 family)
MCLPPVARRIAFVLLWSLTLPCGAQGASSPTPTFIVATIKPSDPNKGAEQRIGFGSGGSFEAKSLSLDELIEFAQNLNSFDVGQRMVGGPKWLGSARFDINAKCDDETARAFGKMPLKQQVLMEQAMVQGLLADRFKLRAHHEMRTLAVFALVQAKSGSKIKPSAKAYDEDREDAQGPQGNWEGDGVSMAELARDLSALPELGGRIVDDKTGLEGRFDFKLLWSPNPVSNAMTPGSDNGGASGSSAPSLFTALREQLGLKLEIAKEPVDVIVIDSVELPTPN